MSLVKKLVFARLEFNILLKSEHIPGYLNSLADSLSRDFSEIPEILSHSRHQPLCHSTPSLEHISEEADLIIKCSMTSNPWKTYKTAVEAFIQFRLIYKFGNIWPALVDEIAICIAFLSYKELAATTVTTYISGLGHAHKIINLTDNTKSFIVCKMLEGLRRKSPQKLNVCTPISFRLLKPFNTFTFASLQFSV